MKPILFNTEMVKAILDGRKTTTRRIVKRKGYNDKIHDPINDFAQNFSDNLWEFGQRWDNRISPQHAVGVRSPFQPGDILYVRETFCPYDVDHIINGVKYAYKADSTPESEEVRKAYGYKWKSSRFMPREAARIFLRVTDVRAERLQGITEDGAKAEGIEYTKDGPLHWHFDDYISKTPVSRNFETYTEAFSALWGSTIKKPDLPLYGWDANPWVWVIEFERCEKERGNSN